MFYRTTVSLGTLLLPLMGSGRTQWLKGVGLQPYNPGSNLSSPHLQAFSVSKLFNFSPWFPHP